MKTEMNDIILQSGFDGVYKISNNDILAIYFKNYILLQNCISVDFITCKLF